MKKLLTFLMAIVLMIVMIGCDTITTAATTTGGVTTTQGSTTQGTTITTELANIESDTGLDRNVEGIIDIVLWSGDGSTLYDLGHSEYTADQLLAQNNAAAYAVAKSFNAIYPNVVINGYFKSGGPDAWSQTLETYRDDEGRFPAVWAARDLAGDVEKGLVADISRFEDDPLYQVVNPSIMNMMNYYGFQAGLPQYILPWGVYVNKSLASANLIEMPGPDWDIDEYSDFVSNYSNNQENQYYGAMDTPLSFINTGVTTVQASLAAYEGGASFLDLNSSEVRSMIHYIGEWVTGSFWGQYDQETLALGEENAGTGPVHTLYANTGNWDYHLFRQGRLLTFDGQPWMMGDCAEQNSSWWAVCNIDDWDIYPRPETDYQDSTIGLVLDPMAVYNYCIDDGDIRCTEEEELKIQIAYTFAIFWCADSRSFAARANQLFLDSASKSYSSALNDSMPIVTGDMFDDQMDYWYTPVKHQRFGSNNMTWSTTYNSSYYSFLIRMNSSGRIAELVSPESSFPILPEGSQLRTDGQFLKYTAETAPEGQDDFIGEYVKTDYNGNIIDPEGLTLLEHKGNPIMLVGTTYDELVALFGEPEEEEIVMPGFQEVLRIYRIGQFWDVSDKSFPWFYSFEGTSRDIMFEWSNYWNPLINGGYSKFDSAFESSILSLLPGWNTAINERFAQAFEDLESGLMDYYFYQPSDFE